MLQNQPISRFATALCTLALALASTCLRADSFTQTNLVSDVPNLAANTDSNLKNPWGVAFSATSPFWASDQATGVATLYGATGTPVSLVVAIPGSASPTSGPTGMVFSNISGSFLVGAAPATFIFDNLNGTISGWNGGQNAVLMVDNSDHGSANGAVYKGATSGEIDGKAVASRTKVGGASPRTMMTHTLPRRLPLDELDKLVIASSFPPPGTSGFLGAVRETLPGGIQRVFPPSRSCAQRGLANRHRPGTFHPAKLPRL